jgi:hypothetical protein
MTLKLLKKINVIGLYTGYIIITVFILMILLRVLRLNQPILIGNIGRVPVQHENCFNKILSPNLSDPWFYASHVILTNFDEDEEAILMYPYFTIFPFLNDVEISCESNE